jgi:hypothetical protein
VRIAIALLAGAKLALHLSTLRPYGWFRDELYYLACARRLAWGYVDHPPLSILVLRGWCAVFGESLAAVRVLPALAGAATVVITAAMARELGGGVLAVSLAGLAVLTMPARLAVDHYYSMNALDALLWPLAALLTLRALRRDRPGSWLALGVALGLGVLDKWSVLWLGLGLGLGLLVSPARTVLRTRWPYLAALLAIALTAPHFVWQARHGWPTLEFMHNALAHKYVRLPLGVFLRETLLMTNPALLPLWVAGALTPVMARDRDRAGVLAIAFWTTIAIVTVTRGKPEYLLASFPLVIAPGAVVWERALSTTRARRLARAAPVLLGVVMLAFAAVTLPFALPVLSVDRFVAYSERLGLRPESSEKKRLGRLPQFYADMHGWPELADAAAHAWNQLPAHERPSARIWAVTGGYGPAAAIDVLGSGRGLPRAISGHNNYWLWGWAGDGDGSGETSAVILLGGHERLGELFEELTLVGRVHCGDCMPYEDDKPVYIGRGMRRTFAELWPTLKRYE